ncbi:IclR family transcriptional regulator C-terminal domain-containing protein [Streptomyces sp. NPDC006510]|uniref:IclR family transcriptional regulator domain-containing protein n=1 Tax=Streptomyces sp. NPDC006510 TaxID=3155600 RepID=UPI0033B4195D
MPPRPEDASAPSAEEIEADFLDRVRKAHDNGWAMDDQLIEPGLIAVTLPVRDPAGAVVCAVSVVSHTSGHSARSLAEQALAPLHRALAAMEAALASPTSTAPAEKAGAADPCGAPSQTEMSGSTLPEAELATRLTRAATEALTPAR